MNASRLIGSLRRFREVLPALVRDLDPADARWRPDDDHWSVLEIVTHLADEEVEDFRARVRSTLEQPEVDWSPIDPQGWAVGRRYNEGDLDASVERFVAERDASLAWLDGLAGADWSTTHTHPRFGSMQAGDLLAAWTAHDQLHARQITKRLYQLTQRDAGDYRTMYAGAWTE